MKTSFNKTDEVNGTIVIEVEKADYHEKVDKALNQYRQRANVPGFRQGKVPKGFIQKMYGKAVMVEEINKLLGEELNNYIRDNKLRVLGEPLPVENEENAMDFDKDENFEFKFDIGLTPEFELPLGKDDNLLYYNVELEDDLLEKQLDAYRQNYGTYEQIEEEAVDTDLLKGTLTEVENGADKEGGMVIENAILMPSYVKDEETKNNFIGSKVGEGVVFNPRKAYDNNEAEIASLLQTTKENVKEINSDFRFDINEVTRYKEAEMNQKLFDQVLGEGVATSEEEFKNKIREALNNQFKPNADYLFISEAKEMILGKMKDVKFPEAFLKRWLLASNEDRTEESLEEDLPKIIEDLKFHIAKEQILEKNDIKIESEDIESLATDVAKAQFAQYGMNNVPAEALQNYVKSLLEKEETLRNLYDRAGENKLIDWLKSTISITEEQIASKDFSELLNKEAEKDKEVEEEKAAKEEEKKEEKEND